MSEGGKDKNGKPEVPRSFITECLRANEHGDGILYAAMMSDRFVYNVHTNEWLAWDGHHWELDVDCRHQSAVAEVAQVYQQEAIQLVNDIVKAPDGEKKRLEAIQKNLYRRVERLNSNRGWDGTCQMAWKNTEMPLQVRNDVLDADPWLMGVKNGVIDLKTGELITGRRDQWITKSAPTEYRGVLEPSPLWEQTLHDIFDGDMTLVEYVQRVFGYAITGLIREHILPVWWGQGRNGKGLVMETVSRVLGPLSGPIQSEMLMDQGRGRSSSGPSPDIMSLRGMRIAFSSETDDGRRFSTSKVKWLSGGDSLIGRAPHDRYETKFSPTHTLFLLTNNIPHAPAEDFAFWERVQLVSFPLSFVNREPVAENERRSDPDLPVKLQEESAGILAWLIRGCIAWQVRGIDPPPAVVEATAQYKRDEDTMQDFLDECCFMDPKAQVSAAALYGAFTEWWTENVNKKGSPSQKKFGKLLAKRRFNKEKRGTYVYFGIGLLDGGGA